jgi:hypothetical protein
MLLHETAATLQMFHPFIPAGFGSSLDSCKKMRGKCGVYALRNIHEMLPQIPSFPHDNVSSWQT